MARVRILRAFRAAVAPQHQTTLPCGVVAVSLFKYFSALHQSYFRIVATLVLRRWGQQFVNVLDVFFSGALNLLLISIWDIFFLDLMRTKVFHWSSQVWGRYCNCCTTNNIELCWMMGMQ